MFAVLLLERDPLQLADIPTGLMRWIQAAGSVAGVFLFLWIIAWVSSKRRPAEGTRSWMPGVFKLLLACGVLGYLGLLALRFPDLLAALSGDEFHNPAAWRVRAGNWAFTFGAGCFLVIVLLPFLANLPSLSGRRILAIARLSFKEAIRRKVLYLFCGLILALLVLNWFVQAKPEYELQSYVEIVFRIMTPLLLASAALLASFSIPTDIKQQTIHTIVTKPVERFEIVLGRFLGYTTLLTLVLIVMSVLSLFYVLRGANPAAADESLKAREPIYGNLSFERVEGEYTENEFATGDAGVNVGRVWNYYTHISGQDERNTREPIVYAVWTFKDLPSKLAKQDTVRCEFAFDIYRQNKGQENRGILCSFFFQTRNYRKTIANRQQYQESRRKGGARVELTPEVDNPVSEKFGYFEVQGKSIRNLHTLNVDIPAGVIRNALAAPEQDVPEDAPVLAVRVRCNSPGQMVGMARYSLYLRGDSEKDEYDRTGFALNYFKASAGLWMRVVMVIAVAVAVSTELGGIISFLCVMLLYLGGVSRPFIQEIAQRTNEGGGPLESATRLFSRQSILTPLPDTTLSKVVTGSDEVFRWLLRALMEVLPDVENFTFTDRVASGFSIGVISQDLLPAFLLLLGYLLPWGLLSFYLIRKREIAGAH